MYADDDFEDEVMNDVDRLLSQIGTSKDRFGPSWSPLDRITHHFHMKDLWSMIGRAYNKKVKNKYILYKYNMILSTYV